MYRAAEQLGMSTSYLKNACRRLGLSRWPRAGRSIGSVTPAKSQPKISIKYSRQLLRKYRETTADRQTMESDDEALLQPDNLSKHKPFSLSREMEHTAGAADCEWIEFESDHNHSLQSEMAGAEHGKLLDDFTQSDATARWRTDDILCREWTVDQCALHSPASGDSCCILAECDSGYHGNGGFCGCGFVGRECIGGGGGGGGFCADSGGGRETVDGETAGGECRGVGGGGDDDDGEFPAIASPGGDSAGCTDGDMW